MKGMMIETDDMMIDTPIHDKKIFIIKSYEYFLIMIIMIIIML